MSDARLTISFIVTFNFQYISRAIASLQHTQTPHHIVVVVNGDAPEQAAALQAEHPHIELLTNISPLSFAENHNMMMARCSTPYIALLNDDIEVQGNALDALVAHLDEHPDVGLVGPQLYYGDGTRQTSAYSDPTLLRMLYKISGLARLTHQRGSLRRWLLKMGLGRIIRLDSLQVFTTPTEVDAIKGAVMVVRREAYLHAGMMDGEMKAYAEELEWQWRLRQHGWKMVIVPDAYVTHFGIGQAELNLTGDKLYNDRLGILIYFLKHRSAWQGLVIRMAIMTSHGFLGIRWRFIERSRALLHWKIVRMAFTWRLPKEELTEAEYRDQDNV